MFSMLCVLMKIISHARAKKKTKRLSNFALLWVVFQWHHGSEGVKAVSPRHCIEASVLRNCCFNCCSEQSHVNQQCLTREVGMGERSDWGGYSFFFSLKTTTSLPFQWLSGTNILLSWCFTSTETVWLIRDGSGTKPVARVLSMALWPTSRLWPHSLVPYPAWLRVEYMYHFTAHSSTTCIG